MCLFEVEKNMELLRRIEHFNIRLLKVEEGRASLSGRTFRWFNGGKEIGAYCRFTGHIILLVNIKCLLTYSKLEYIIPNIVNLG